MANLVDVNWKDRNAFHGMLLGDKNMHIPRCIDKEPFVDERSALSYQVKFIEFIIVTGN